MSNYFCWNEDCMNYIMIISLIFLAEILPSGHGLFFKIRQGRHHISFAKGSSVWQIRHPLIFNKWFKTTLTWNSDNGLKFYVNGKLMASDTSRLNVPDISEPLMLWIGSEENSGGWSRSIAIDDVSVWSMALSDETIKRESEGICFGYLGGVQFCDEGTLQSVLLLPDVLWQVFCNWTFFAGAIMPWIFSISIFSSEFSKEEQTRANSYRFY